MSENLDWKNVMLASAFHMTEMLEFLLKVTKEYWRSYDRKQETPSKRKSQEDGGIGPYEAMPKARRKKALAAIQAVIDDFRIERRREDNEVGVGYGRWCQHIDRLSHLCYKHPDALRESGFTFSGALDLMAMAAAMEAAKYAYYESGGGLLSGDDTLWKPEGAASKMLYYMFLAFSQAPSKYRGLCLEWVAHNIQFNQYAFAGLKAHKAVITARTKTK